MNLIKNNKDDKIIGKLISFENQFKNKQKNKV
jgi:hypothetical protein